MTYASLYTVDGQFGSGANATKGREALKNMIAGPRQRQASAQPAVTCPRLIKSRNVAPVD